MKIKILSNLLIYMGLITVTTVNASVVINSNSSYVDNFAARIHHASDSIISSDRDNESFTDLNIPNSFDVTARTLIQDTTSDTHTYIRADTFLFGSMSSNSRPMDIEMNLVVDQMIAETPIGIDVWSYAESVFDISFTTDKTYEFNLSGNLGLYPVEPGVNSQINMSLTNSHGEFLINHSGTTRIFDHSDSVIAAADQYQLRVSVVSEIYTTNGQGVNIIDVFGTFGRFKFDVTPTVVPIPAAVWLFGTGILGLIGSARNRAFKVAN